ncbi:MAG: hypothetical protein KDK50_04000 [Chlamydiia bacterium]|nr:hypothetical protein [Chlamydiia bacterium]
MNLQIKDKRLVHSLQWVSKCNSQSKKLFLSSLLPDDPRLKIKSRLHNGVAEYRFLISAAEQTMMHLQENHFDFFDPLVGENACQIRALKNAIIFSKDLVDTKDFLNNIAAIKKKMDGLIPKMSGLAKNSISLQDLIDDGLEIEMSDDILYLISSYILTVAKVISQSVGAAHLVSEHTDNKKIQEIWPCSSRFATRLIKALRQSLSRSSVAYVQSIVRTLAVPDPIIESVSDQYVIDYNHLQCLPCYWVTAPLLLQALDKRIPFIIIARQIALDRGGKCLKETAFYLKPTLNGYKSALFEEFDPNTPAMLMIGDTRRDIQDLPDLATWREELLEIGLLDLVFAHAASHRQYPGGLSDSIPKTSDMGYKYYQNKAQEWGCTIDNPSLLLIHHAYCDTVQNVHGRICKSTECLNVGC